MSQMYRIYGVDNSCYTQKVVAAARGLGLPHAYHFKSIVNREQIEAAAGGYTKMPVVETPAGQWWTESSAILQKLDAAAGGNIIVPSDPVLAYISDHLEFWLDEWLIRPAVFWRANVEIDRQAITRIAARNLMGLTRDAPLIDEQAAKMQRVADRLAPFFESIGARHRAELAHEDEVVDLLSRSCDLLSSIFLRQPYLLGGRPCCADYALAGLLIGHLLLDPTPAQLIAERWPALVASAQRIASSRAGEGDWHSGDSLPAPLRGLLRYIAEDFHPYVAANRDAVAADAPIATWDGLSHPARPEVEGERVALRARLTQMSENDDKRIQTLIGGLGLLTVL
jgi:glutathione S-transferase